MDFPAMELITRGFCSTRGYGWPIQEHLPKGLAGFVPSCWARWRLWRWLPLWSSWDQGPMASCGNAVRSWGMPRWSNFKTLRPCRFVFYIFPIFFYVHVMCHVFMWSYAWNPRLSQCCCREARETSTVGLSNTALNFLQEFWVLKRAGVDASTPK